MPVTKRLAHKGSPKALLEYILDEKNNGDKVGITSSINCNVETAVLEFLDMQKKYKMNGERTAYHIIQSFSPQDNITQEQANEIGKKLCEELYSNYQCVISTHTDRSCLHNHIAINAINMNGKKLEDRLSNKKEGLYALSNTSDKIAEKYGCLVMEKKQYNKNKNKSNYYHSNSYNEYQKIKYQEIKKYYNQKRQLEYLEKYNIHSFDDIENEILIRRRKIKDINIVLKNQRGKVAKVQEITQKAQQYIQLYKIYEKALWYKKQKPEYVFPKEVQIFLNLKKELNITSVEEANEIIKLARIEILKLNNMKNQVLKLQRELNQLDTIKESKLLKSDLFVHKIKFGKNHIIYDKSDDKYFCVNLPYTKERIKIPKENTTFNVKNKFYTLYLEKYKEYELLNLNNEKICNITGIELEQYVANKKEEIDKTYS